jgi:hypothetical protein
MPLLSPLLWQGLPFKHADGEMDFLGMHDHWHAALGKAAGGIPEFRLDNLKDMGEIHQRLHDELTQTLGIEPSPDFSLFDLNQAQGWALFMQLHSIEHERLRAATGL